MTDHQWNIVCRFMYVMLRFAIAQTRFVQQEEIEKLIADVLNEGKATVGKSTAVVGIENNSWAAKAAEAFRKAEAEKKIWHAFYTVWDFAVGKADYDKEEFIVLEAKLRRMHDEAKDQKQLREEQIRATELRQLETLKAKYGK